MPRPIFPAGDSKPILEKETVEGIHLWDIDDPYLYTAKVTVCRDGKVEDADCVRVGFRTIACRAEGFYLNGRHVKLYGLDRHQSYPYVGYAMPERVTGDKDFYKKRFAQLKNWEQHLYENGYRMVKIFLNISKEEQRRRFIDRMELPEKHWKLSIDDMKERALWKEYDAAYEDAINHTATEESPWYVLPADDKWFTRYLMSEILLDVLTDMAPEYPPLDPAEAAKVPQALAELEGPIE